jgi:hypothetical protein
MVDFMIKHVVDYDTHFIDQLFDRYDRAPDVDSPHRDEQEPHSTANPAAHDSQQDQE